MKQILLITLLLLATAFTVRAQSTFENPYRGATHNYNATVAAGAGLVTRWYVATDAAGNKAVQGTDYTVTAASGAFSALENAWTGTGVYAVDITWGLGLTVGNNYYVFLEVDDAVSGCTNNMALQVTIASDFNALAYNVTGSANPFAAVQGDADIVAANCPDDIVNPVFDGTGHTNIGTTQVVFKVERQFSVVAWQFEYSVNNGGTALAGLSNVRIVNGSNTQLYNGTNSTGIISLAANQDFALVYLTIANQQGATINIDFDLIIANGNTSDTDGNLDSSADNASYTIQPLPVITGFGGM
jgi:hypothetical protein